MSALAPRLESLASRESRISTAVLKPPAPVRPSVRRDRGPRWGLLDLVVIAQTVIPAMLFLPGIQAVRPLVRAASYVTGLSGLAFRQSRRVERLQRHPSAGWILLIMAYLVGVFLLSLDRLLPAAGQFVLICSVLAPACWGAKCIHDVRQLHRLLWLILLTSGVNSLVGVLQVYDPDRWMPPELSRQILNAGLYRYFGANGQVVMRPCGLYDTPGAVCAPGAWAAIVGFALLQSERSYFRKAIALGCAFVGAAVIYLTLVRTALVVVLIGAATYAVLLVIRKQADRAVSFGLMTGGTLVAAMLFATIFGGDAISGRFSTLFQSDPGELYYQSRGVQLEHAIVNDALEMPLGVGLGSWGVIAMIFGGGSRFAELQIHGWLYDGGIPLVVMYSIALAIAVYHDLRICLTTPNKLLFQAGCCIAAINVSTVVTVFSFVPFNTPVGMQFWLLSSALHGAYLVDQRQRAIPDNHSN